MSLHRHTATLLEVTEATSEDQTGSTWAVLPSEGDGVADPSQGFGVFITATQDGGATSPTTDVTVETSVDGDNWVEVASATQLTADGTQTEMDTIDNLGPYVRATTTLGGGTAPDHTVSVVLTSDAPFKLVQVS